MSPPRLSVLLPCRNTAPTLEAAAASLSAQTFADFEVVAVDDGSDDGTPDLLAAWAARDGRIHPVRTPPRGIVAALRTAAARAEGELLARMDADDIAKPARLERQVAYLDARPDVAACGTRVRYIPRRLVRDGARRYERWINDVVSPDDIERDLFVECPIPHPTLLVRRGAFARAGGYRDTEWPEDYDLVLRLWATGERMGKVPEVLLEWREGEDRLSRTDPRYAEEAFRRCKVHYLARRIGGRPVVVWGAGPVGKAFARTLQAARQHVIAFVELDRRKLGQTIHDALVIHPSDLKQYRSAYVVGAVGSPEARAEIRAALAAAGFREPEECCAVA
ncbi:MAG: glycosyltransferase [Gemmatimonadota bacterium]|nr:MAG: glycosyltransferase [Gemmatimonadota bacterium]